MKPTLDICNQRDSSALTAPTSQVFPKTARNCRALTLADLNGRCDGSCRSSFRAIGQSYFANEVPRYFVYEAVLFFIMMMTVTLPLLNASAAVMELIRI